MRDVGALAARAIRPRRILNRQYLNLLDHVKWTGIRKEDRTGAGTISTFGYQMRLESVAWFPAPDHEETAPQVDHP